MPKEKVIVFVEPVTVRSYDGLAETLQVPRSAAFRMGLEAGLPYVHQQAARRQSRVPTALLGAALGYVVYAHGAARCRSGLRAVRPWRCQSARWATCRTPMALPVDALGYVCTPMALSVGALGYVLYAHGAASRRAGLRVVRPWRCQPTRWATRRTPTALLVAALGYVLCAHGAASAVP